MAEDRKKTPEPEANHHLNMDNREKLSLDGVKAVGSFDDQEIVIETSAGGLIIRGRDLNITQLNLDLGKLSVQGFIKTLDYVDDGLGKRSRGLFGRLLK